MFHLFTGVIGLWVIGRFVWLLSWSIEARCMLALAIMLVVEHHLITRTFFGSMASPEVPSGVLMALGWAFGAVLLLAIFLLIMDSVGGVIWLFSHDTGRSVLAATGIRALAALVAMALSAWGVWQAVRIPDVKRVELTLPRLPPEMDGLRVVQLTDLHASHLLEAPWISAVVKKANALNPDIMLITGDLVDGKPDHRAKDVQPYTQLHARYGVFAIPGNHEYYSDYVSWLTTFKSLGLPMLLNAHTTVMHNGKPLVIAGVTDRAAANFDQPLPDIDRALKDAPADAPVILMSHRPGGAVNNAEKGVDLQLSGHTHGGQILGTHFLAKWANEGFVSGLYQVGGMALYVSNGTGLWNGFPVRIGRPSEITEFVLRAPK